MVLLHARGYSVADLAAEKQFGEVVVDFSKLAPKPDQILADLELENVVRLAALGFSMPDELQDLLSCLPGDLGSTDTRDLKWIHELVLRAGVLACPYLIKAVTLPDPVKRGHAAYLLGLTRDPEAVPVLVRLLSDPAEVGIVEWLPTVGAAATLALREIGTPEAIAALEEGT